MSTDGLAIAAERADQPEGIVHRALRAVGDIHNPRHIGWPARVDGGHRHPVADLDDVVHVLANEPGGPAGEAGLRPEALTFVLVPRARSPHARLLWRARILAQPQLIGCNGPPQGRTVAQAAKGDDDRGCPCAAHAAGAERTGRLADESSGRRRRECVLFVLPAARYTV